MYCFLQSFITNDQTTSTTVTLRGVHQPLIACKTTILLCVCFFLYSKLFCVNNDFRPFFVIILRFFKHSLSTTRHQHLFVFLQCLFETLFSFPPRCRYLLRITTFHVFPPLLLWYNFLFFLLLHICIKNS